MANSRRQEDNGLQATAQREIEIIVTTLAVSPDNALIETDNLRNSLQELTLAASRSLDAAERYISSQDRDHIKSHLWEAWKACTQVRIKVKNDLELARERYELALRTSSGNRSVSMQQVINECSRSSLWSRIACRRANVASPPRRAYHFTHANRALLRFHEARYHWNAAKDTLQTVLNSVSDRLDKAAQLLAPLPPTETNPDDLSLKETHRFLNDIQKIMTTIGTAMDGFLAVHDEIADIRRYLNLECG